MKSVQLRKLGPCLFVVAVFDLLEEVTIGSRLIVDDLIES